MRPVTLSVLGLAAIAAGFAGGMGYGSMSMDHSAMVMGVPKGDDQGPSSVAFAQANAAMHGEMDIDFSGNADRDFAAGMIAHHKGAVEMAKIELEFGSNPEMRALAEAIIAAQQPEIDQMTQWLAANP